MKLVRCVWETYQKLSIYLTEIVMSFNTYSYKVCVICAPYIKPRLNDKTVFSKIVFVAHNMGQINDQAFPRSRSKILDKKLLILIKHGRRQNGQTCLFNTMLDKTVLLAGALCMRVACMEKRKSFKNKALFGLFFYFKWTCCQTRHIMHLLYIKKDEKKPINNTALVLRQTGYCKLKQKQTDKSKNKTCYLFFTRSLF